MQISKEARWARRLCQLHSIPFPFLLLLYLPHFVVPLWIWHKERNPRRTTLLTKWIVCYCCNRIPVAASHLHHICPCSSYPYPLSRCASRLISLGVINLSWSNEFGCFECLPRREKETKKKRERKRNHIKRPPCLLGSLPQISRWISTEFPTNFLVAFRVLCLNCWPASANSLSLQFKHFLLNYLKWKIKCFLPKNALKADEIL